ncbi:MAG: Sua5/YciO/YrdC/YwlC family protein [Acidobacteria bacterium]|nr:Sua5/YciO/YrdC/YwlC family protein [Acidobacteriota bacterium]
MPRIDLKAGDSKKQVARALKEIRAGYVIVAPLEHGYVYLADAFSQYAVRALHVLRGDEDGIAAQVLAHSADTVSGIARELSADAEKLMKEFWPGLLSLNLRPNIGLNWDLGDDKELDLFSVRVPKATFVRAILKQSGPLAVASAAPAGSGPLLKINRADIKEWDVAAVFDKGPLKAGPQSTVVEVSGSDLRLVRPGAISSQQLLKVAPKILGISKA